MNPEKEPNRTMEDGEIHIPKFVSQRKFQKPLVQQNRHSVPSKKPASVIWPSKRTIPQKRKHNPARNQRNKTIQTQSWKGRSSSKQGRKPMDLFTVICLWLMFWIVVVMGIGIWSIVMSGVFSSGGHDTKVSNDSFLLTQNSMDDENGKKRSVPDWVLKDLLPLNEYSRPGTKLDAVNGVVVHYTGNPGTTAEQNRSYYEQLAKTHETKVSSHFVIGIDGTIIQCVPLDEVAYCSNHRNSDTISIECCHLDNKGQFSKATLDSLTKLLKWLTEAYHLRQEQILRHYDVTGKECPKYYVDHPDEWEDFLDRIVFSPY